ncbi:MAG: hypothetical protein R3301_19720 [Saprospiraceae bacterium]|nr:hypothetical protein [Saprospiraceae bacterium]
MKGRIDLISMALWSTTAAPTGTFERAYSEAAEAIDGVLMALQAIQESVQALETALDAAGAPYTPGRGPGRN